MSMLTRGNWHHHQSVLGGRPNTFSEKILILFSKETDFLPHISRLAQNGHFLPISCQTAQASLAGRHTFSGAITKSGQISDVVLKIQFNKLAKHRRHASRVYFAKYINTLWKNTRWENILWEDTLWENTLWENTLWKIHFKKYTFGQYTFRKYTFGKHTFRKYTFRKYTFRKYTSPFDSSSDKKYAASHDLDSSSSKVSRTDWHGMCLKHLRV